MEGLCTEEEMWLTAFALRAFHCSRGRGLFTVCLASRRMEMTSASPHSVRACEPDPRGVTENGPELWAQPRRLSLNLLIQPIMESFSTFMSYSHRPDCLRKRRADGEPAVSEICVGKMRGLLGGREKGDEIIDSN